MARLVTSATDILLRDTAGLEPPPAARAASEIAVGALRSALSPIVGFGPERRVLELVGQGLGDVVKYLEPKCLSGL
jgi:hypothetical protein